MVCANCGTENVEGAKFCTECAAPLGAAAFGGEKRKTVTVLFCDLTGSTAMGEELDPERLRVVLAGYFERMKAIIELHGGTVEKFVGDAVMAVFGVPVLHEDDALRAVRAAAEMRDALPGLGLQGRIGVMTGEVVTGTEERLATGDAVNVAARLEQAAAPGDVLIGEPTLELVGEAAEVAPVERLALKGKTGHVPAYRLLRVLDEAPRRHEGAFVGRGREQAALEEAWRRVRDERRPELVTVVGDPGIGKSRLVAELLASVEATVARGRCLPYGEGITYWPVVEVLKQLDVTPVDATAAAAIRSLLGEAEVTTSADELAWAFRKTLEQTAAERPLVVVFDDIQWAEETFLDLVEHVALLAADAPLLLVCIARPDLLERRPAWPVTIRLAPLGDGDVDELFPAELPDDLRVRIKRSAGGNPLFVTEMLAMAADERAGEVSVPPNLHALLAARLDRLEASERSVLERGAVEGEIFHRSAVQTLDPEHAQVTTRLASLVRKEVIRSDKPRFAGEDGFRFRHLLMRDAAYNGLPKTVRADLHERFAEWLDEHGHDLVEADELVGYHLEQAAVYLRELGRADAALATRAGERLAAAGRRALWRGDYRSAASLLARSLTLQRPARLDVHLEIELAFATIRDPGAPANAGPEIAAAAAARAGELGETQAAALASLFADLSRVTLVESPDLSELQVRTKEVVARLEAEGDDAGLAYVWIAYGGSVTNFLGRWDDWADAAERGLHHARRAGHRWSTGFGLATALAVGPRPADDALETLDRVLGETPTPQDALVRAWLLGMLGHVEEATALAKDAAVSTQALGGYPAGWMLAEIAILAGDHQSAYGHLRAQYDFFDVRGQRAHLSGYAPLLGRTLCALGRHEEAEPLALLGRELGDKHDVVSQVFWRQALALVESNRGNHESAIELAREAVAIAGATDGLNIQGNTLSDLADVLDGAGRADEAAEARAQALDRYLRKRNLPLADRTRAAM
jgi:class 3 adenylate cyclase/tetratricopeptide (TPR) repeat protein